MRQAKIWRWSTAVVVLASATIACGDDNGSAGPTPTIQLTASPTSLTIQQGTSQTVTITLVRGGGFSGAVTATVTGLPTEIVVSGSPASLSGTTTTATVTLNVGAAVAAGVYTATVTGAGSGVANATATFTVTVTLAPNVALAVTPTTITVPQGTSGNATVNITRTNFTGAVALTLDAPPAGVSGNFNPASTTANTSALTVAVAGTVPQGNYTLTIKGTATGVGDRTTTLALVVAAPPGTITIALTPQAASVAQGSSGQATVTITRTNFTGAVTLASSGAPAGITIGFSQSPTTASQVQLTYAAGLTAPLGTHSITVTASGTGVSNATATFALTVTQAPPAGQVEVQFCSSSENPVFFAYQDGTGAWQRVTETLSGGVYRYIFSITQGRGGVFFVQQSGTSTTSTGTLGALTRAPMLDRILPDATARLGIARATTVAQPYETSVFYGTTAELTAAGVENCAATMSTKSVFLSFAGVGGGQTATLSLGGNTQFVIGGLTPSPVQFTEVATGTIDFFGSRESATTGVPDKFFDMRNLNPADGSTLPFVADFNSANAYAPASAQLTIGNALGDELVSFATFITSNGEAGLLGGSAAPTTAVTRTWYGVPTARLQTGDVHASILFASPATTTTDEIRLHFSFTTTVQNLTPLLGSRLPTPTVASVGQPAYPRLRVQGTLPAEYNDLVFVEFGPSGGGNEISVMATGAYIVATTGGATYDLSIPDLTALAGFPLVSALPAGEIEATVNANGWTGIGIMEPVPVNGGVFQGAAKTVKITP